MDWSVGVNQTASALLDAWGTPDWDDALARFLSSVEARSLPLTRLLSYGSFPLEEGMVLRLLSATRPQDGVLLLKVAVFFDSVLAGCSCADDPSGESVFAEYGELELLLSPSEAMAIRVAA